jgi:hypothetical protein
VDALLVFTAGDLDPVRAKATTGHGWEGTRLAPPAGTGLQVDRPVRVRWVLGERVEIRPALHRHRDDVALKEAKQSLQRAEAQKSVQPTE